MAKRVTKRYGLRRVWLRKGREYDDVLWYHTEQSREFAYRICQNDKHYVKLERLNESNIT